MMRARSLVEQHLKVKTKKAQPAHFQGMYSETVIVSTEDGATCVIQFRAEPLDVIPFQEARKLMGSLVPIAQVLRDEELESFDIWPVYLSYIPGESWAASKKQNDAAFNVTVMKSLGRVLTKCFIEKPSAAVIQVEVIAKLDRLLKSGYEAVQPFLIAIRDLRMRAGELAELPLFLTHMDINMMNIMVDEDGQVTGIVDWELSGPPVPFGMGLNRIHDLAGEYRNGVHYERKNFKDMEEVFFTELVQGAPESVRGTLEKNPEAIQLSLNNGLVLSVFDLDNGGTFNMVLVRALPKLLTYRIPALRRPDEGPYASTSSEKS